MKRKGNVLFFAFIVIALVFLAVWMIFFSDSASYYLAAAIILVLSLLPFFMAYERSAPTAGEIALVSALTALAVASRAVFYLIPQFKPIGAVVIVSAVCLGARRGYIIGALSAFISNFIFGQGVWTPFQMVALGLVGFAAGLIFKKLKANRWLLALVGFILTFALYGIVAGAVFACHLGGCVGDLHWTLMYLTKYKNCNTLMRDTGPEQWLYVPAEEAEKYGLPVLQTQEQ